MMLLTFIVLVPIEKTFELRYNNCLIINSISYLLEDYDGLKDGWCILGLQRIESCTFNDS